MPTDCHGRTVLFEEQGKVVARVHGGDVRKELLNILRVKLAGRLAIIHKAIMPSLARLIRTDAALESDEQQFGLWRLDYLLWIGAQVLQVEAGT